MRFASVCSGIEAASVAWHPLGWEAAWLSEIDPFPCAVLAHHYPTTPNLGDMTKISEADLERHGHVDLLVGGTPCQSFSVAGLRKGMADPRGGLALVFLELARRTRARWVVWENVPGVLSSDGGRAFGSFLGGLAELGYGFAYRVLDAQYFGLAQRRKRVFVVGHLGDWRRAAAVLLERAGLRGDSAPRRETGAGTAARAWLGPAECGWPSEVAPTLGVSWAHRSPGNMQEIHAQKGGLFVPDVVGSLCADSHPGGYSGQDAYTGRLVTHSLRADGFDASEDGTGRGTPLVPVAYRKSRRAADANDDETWVDDGVANTLNGFDVSDVRTTHAVVAFAQNQRGEVRDLGDAACAVREEGTNERTRVSIGFNVNARPDEMRFLEDHAGTVTKSQVSGVSGVSGVRRLTPRECCRLQGFPDDYLDIPYRGKPASDGPKYKALGNSMATNVMRWIGERIAEVEAIS